MKKAFCVLLSLLLILYSSAALSDSQNDITGNVALDILRDDESMLITSDKFPGIAITLSESDTGVISADVIGVLLKIRPEHLVSVTQRFAEALKTWMLTHQFTSEETGLFTGDAFQKAHTKKKFEISTQEMPSFLGMLQDPGLALAEIYTSLAGENRGLNGAVYDDGRYFSVNVLNGEDCILTLSADVSDPDDSCLVVGFGNGVSYYFHEIRIRKEERETVCDLTLFNGEEPYFVPERRLPVQTIHLAFLSEEENIFAFSGEADAVPLAYPIRFSGTVSDCYRIREPEGYVKIRISTLLELASSAVRLYPTFDILEIINAFRGV